MPCTVAMSSTYTFAASLILRDVLPHEGGNSQERGLRAIRPRTNVTDEIFTWFLTGQCRANDGSKFEFDDLIFLKTHFLYSLMMFLVCTMYVL